MRNFQDTFGTRRRSFISDLSICMTVPLNQLTLENLGKGAIDMLQ